MLKFKLAHIFFMIRQKISIIIKVVIKIFKKVIHIRSIKQ